MSRPAHSSRTAMSRPRTARALALAVLALASICSIAVAAYGHGRLAGAAASASASTTLAQPAEPLRSWLYTNRAAWRSSPGMRVVARMTDRSGGQAVATATADAEGDVALAFAAVSDPGGGRGAAGARPSIIEPGDTFSVEADGVEVVRIVVPDLSADAEVDPPRAFGTAPAGMDVAVAFSGAGRPPFAGMVTVGSDGRFAVDLVDAFEFEYGDSGWVTFTDAAGHAFIVRAAPLTVEITLGTGRARVLASSSLRTDLLIHRQGRQVRAYDRYARGPDPFDTGWTTLEYTIGDAREAISPGAVVTATQLGDPLSEPRARAATLPELELALDTSGTVLIGRAPPGAALRVTLQAPDGSETTRHTAAAADGGVRVDLEEPLLPGSRAALHYDGGQGSWFVAPLVVPQVRVRAYEGIVEGLAPPLGTVTVTVASPSQPTAFSWPARADSDGAFAVDTRMDDPETLPRCDAFPQCEGALPLVPGDQISIELVAGDPVALTVPALVTRTDPDAETVAGTAPPGATIAVYAGLPWATRRGRDDMAAGAPPVANVVADLDGAYSAALAPAIDIEPPLGGYAVVEVRGHLVAAAWQPLVVLAWLDNALIETVGVPGRPLSATLRAADGQAVARLATTIERGRLRDEVGQLPEIVPGDQIEVQRGDDRVTLPIPAFTGRVHIEDDLVVGQSPPGSTVRLQYGAAEATATADAAGLFRHDFGAEGVDLQHNKTLAMALNAGPGLRHTFQRTLSLPGLTLALHTSELRGAFEPLLDLVITAERGATTLARPTVRTDFRASFRATLAGADGRRLQLEPGDRIAVSATEATLQPSLELVVPRLSVDVDPSADSVSGAMPPDASLTVALAHWFIFDYGAPVRGWAAPIPDATGRWSAGFQASSPEGVDIRPGSVVDAELRLPSGHIVLQRVAQPMLSAQVDGTWVCGQAAPLAEVSVQAADASGAALLAGTGSADADGLFAFALADVAGLERTMAPGTTVRGRLGDADVDLTVPPLDVEVDWGTGAVDLFTQPSAEVTLDVGAHGCLALPVGTGEDYAAAFDRADGQGRATIDKFFPDQLAQDVVAAAFTSTGMRAYRGASRRTADVYIDTPRLVVTATARTALAVVLAAAGGRELAQAAAVADDAGRAEAMVVDAGGNPVPIRAGHQLTIADGGDVTRITVPPLAFDASRGRGLEGQAAPGQDVALRLTLADGRRIAFVRQTDERGRFVFTPAMMPVRSTWRWEDVRHVEAAVALPGGHRMLSEATLAGGEQAPAFLPVGFSGLRR